MHSILLPYLVNDLMVCPDVALVQCNIVLLAEPLQKQHVHALEISPIWHLVDETISEEEASSEGYLGCLFLPLANGNQASLKS